MTQIVSKPTSSAVCTTRARVGPIPAAPPGHVKLLIWRPNFTGPAGASSLDRDALPEGDVALDVHGRVGRVGVVPRRVGVLLAVHGEGVVAGLSLPVTRRVGIAGPQEFGLHRL